MLKKTLNKRLLILFLILFPTAMLFGFLNNVRAGDDIPDKTDDPENRNEWTWGVERGNELAYEVEIIMTEYETGDLYWQMGFLDILNISEIDNDFFEFMGDYDNMSYVEAKRCYYECYSEGGGEVVEIEEEDPDKISVFGYNFSDTISEKIIAASENRFYPPLLLPLNDSDICPTMHNIIYESQIEPFENKYVNGFNTRGLETVDSSRYKIWFQNTTEDYFINGTYFKDNGTLESAEAYFLMNMGENGGDWGVINVTMNRVYGPDYCKAITEDVDWGFEVGDVFYFGRNNEEFKVIITNKTWCTSIESYIMDFEIPQPYNVVNASIHQWDSDSQQYSIDGEEEIIAAANNFYPFPLEVLFEGGEDGGGPVLAIPEGTDAEYMAFLLNNFTMEEWPGEAYITDNGKTVELAFEEDGGLMHLQFNESGMLKLGYMEFGGWLEGVIFMKNMTILEDGADWEPLGLDIVGNNNVLVNFTATDDLELYSAVLPVNPLEPLYMEDDSYLGCYFQYEIPDLPLYIDMYVNDTSVVGNQVFMNITYDPVPFNTYNIPETKIKVYGFNYSGNNEWDEAPANLYIVDPENHEIAINATIAINNKLPYITIGVEEYWNWSADVFNAKGDILIYESLGKLGGNISEFGGVVQIPYINFAILNITDVGLVTQDYKGDPQDFNQVNASLMYYEPEDEKLVTWDESGDYPGPGVFTLSEYYYNQSRPQGENFYLNLTENMLGFPMIIPLRHDKLALPIIGRVLNESFYSSQLAKDIGFPIWDDIRVNTLKNILLFNDTTSDYFMELTYYDNGTLESADVSTQFTIDSVDIDFNLTSTRVSDWNTTSEVEWGLEIGESYYFGSNYPEGGPTMEANITIVNINQSAVYLAELFGFGEGAFMFQTWLTFENVWAKMEFWNITDHEGGEWASMDESTFIIAAANNYFPFAPGDYLDYHDLEGELVPILMPKGTTGYNITEDFLDYLAMQILDYYEGEVIPIVSGVSDNYLRVDLVAPNYPEYSGYLEWYLDVNTGITRLYYNYEEYEDESFISATFIKNHTSGIGDDIFEFNNYLVPDINITAEVESDGNYDFFEAMLNKNPVNSSMPSVIGTPMFYMDLFYINKTPDSYNLTFTMELPSKYNVNYVNYIVMYNVNYKTGDGKWESNHLNDIPVGGVTKDYQNNILILRIENMNGSISSILAWMYTPPAAVSDGGGGGGGGGDDDSLEVPGYDIYLMLGGIALLSVALIIKRKRIIKI